MTDAHRQRVRELLALFAGREEIADIGQFSKAEHTRLAWAERHRLVISERKPWPGPLVGTCVKTFYVRIGF
jgi:hypothetical protein